MTTDIKKIKRAKLIKRIGIIGAAVSGVAIVTILVISLLPSYNSAFTLQIDPINDTNVSSHFAMSSGRPGVDGEEDVEYTTYLRGEPLTSVKTSEASNVEAYLDSLEELEGSQNFVDENDYQRAIVYTVYLSNTSSEEDQLIYFDVKLDGYNAPTNVSEDPLLYFRVLTQTSIVGETEFKNTYYGNRRTYQVDEFPNPDGSDNEPISACHAALDGELNNVLVSDFSSAGNDGYCINFDDYRISGYLVKSAEIFVPAGKVFRFTFAAYFEGRDNDAGGNPPENSYFIFSVHFGV